MKPMGFYTIVLCVLVALLSDSARAEWIILTSGEKFQTDRSWREAGRLKFRLNGLVVSVPESDVAKIVVPGAPAPQPTATAQGTAPPTKAVSGSAAIKSTPGAKTADATRTNRRQRLEGALRLPPPSSSGARTGAASPAPGKGSDPIAAPAKGAATTPAASAATPQDRRTAVFRHLSWGMRPSSLPGLLLSQTNPAYGGVDEFYYPEEDLRLGAAPLTGILYGFWQNRLYTITIWADGRPSYEKLRQWVLETYGPGRQSDESIERRVWYGDGSDRLLEFDDTLNTGIFWMRSAKLHARIQQHQAP